MSSFNLDEEGAAEFEEWAKHHRETTIKAMAESAMVFSLYPSGGRDGVDIEYALQVGAMVLFEKPILLFIMPGQSIPEKLRMVADEVIEIHPDEIDLGSERVRGLIHAFMDKHVEGRPKP